MKVQWNIHIGTLKGHRSGTLEINDEDLEYMSDTEKDNYIDELAKEDMFNKLEFYWEKVE